MAGCYDVSGNWFERLEIWSSFGSRTWVLSLQLFAAYFLHRWRHLRLVQRTRPRYCQIFVWASEPSCSRSCTRIFEAPRAKTSIMIASTTAPYCQWFMSEMGYRFDWWTCRWGATQADLCCQLFENFTSGIATFEPRFDWMCWSRTSASKFHLKLSLQFGLGIGHVLRSSVWVIVAPHSSDHCT